MHDFTRACMRRATMTALFLGLLAPSLAAQDHGFALGLTGGWTWPGELTPGFSSPTELEPGSSLGAQLELWPGSGRFGVRANGAYGDRSVAGEPDQGYVVYSADLGILMRILPARERAWVVPFVSLGAGVSMFEADAGSPPFGDGQYGEDPVIRPAAVAGFGLDLLPYRFFGLRVEARDRVVFPSVGESPDASGLPFAHNVEVVSAVQLRLGSPRPQRVVAAASPAPEPAAAEPRGEDRDSARAASTRTASAQAVADAREPAQQEDQPTADQPTAESHPDRDGAAAALAAERRWQEAVRERERGEREAGVRTERAAPSRAEPAGSGNAGGPLGAPLATDADGAPAEATAPAASGPAGTPVDTPASRTPASPAPAAANVPAAEPRAEGEALFTVQIGSLMDETRARRWEERLRARDLPVWLTATVVRGERLHRVRVGALPGQAEAQSFARALEYEFGWIGSVDRITGNEGMPEDAVTATRRFLRGP